MAHDALDAMLRGLKASVLPPKMQAVTVKYHFVLDGAEPCDILLDHGALSLDQSKSPAACQIECSASEFSAILSGRHNMLTSFMRGDTRLKGALGAAKHLYTFLRYAHHEEAHP